MRPGRQPPPAGPPGRPGKHARRLTAARHGGSYSTWAARTRTSTKSQHHSGGSRAAGKRASQAPGPRYRLPGLLRQLLHSGAAPPFAVVLTWAQAHLMAFVPVPPAVIPVRAHPACARAAGQRACQPLRFPRMMLACHSMLPKTNLGCAWARISCRYPRHREHTPPVPHRRPSACRPRPAARPRAATAAGWRRRPSP